MIKLKVNLPNFKLNFQTDLIAHLIWILCYFPFNFAGLILIHPECKVVTIFVGSVSEMLRLPESGSSDAFKDKK